VFRGPRRCAELFDVTTSAFNQNEMAPLLLLRNASGGLRNQPRGPEHKEAAMIGFIAFAEITGAILAAFALAVCLEWMGLHGLIRLMPARRNPPEGQSH
jgi:hypothetical protein